MDRFSIAARQINAIRYAGAAQANLLVADTGGRATIPVEIVLRIDAGKGTLAP